MITYFDNAARGNEYVMFKMHVSTTRRHMKSSSRLNLFEVKMKYLAFILKAVERNIRQKKKKPISTCERENERQNFVLLKLTECKDNHSGCAQEITPSKTLYFFSCTLSSHKLKRSVGHKLVSLKEYR